LHQQVESFCEQEFINFANQRVSSVQPLNLGWIDLGEDGNHICLVWVDVMNHADIQGQVCSQVDHVESQEQFIWMVFDVLVFDIKWTVSICFYFDDALLWMYNKVRDWIDCYVCNALFVNVAIVLKKAW